MPDHELEHDDPREPYIPTVPDVAYDLGQPGWPKVLVTEKLADTVQDYVQKRPDDSDHPFTFDKNAVCGPHETDSVFRCVYLPGSPLDTPSTAYPVPESRLARCRVELADAIDGESHGHTRHPREVIKRDVLETILTEAIALEEVNDKVVIFRNLTTLLEEAIDDRGVVQQAVELAEAKRPDLQVNNDESPDDGGEDPSSDADPEGERPEDGAESGDDGDLGDFEDPSDE